VPIKVRQKELILRAIEFIDEHGVPNRRNSKEYYLLYNGTLYPPRYVLDIAKTFEDGENILGYKEKGLGMHSFLENLDFKIYYPKDKIDKDSYKRPYITDTQSSKEEHENKRFIPALEPSKRTREYHIYSEGKKDSVIYEYLFNSRSHRWLDEKVLGIPSGKRTGHESMNILHFVGLRGKHKGLFKGYSMLGAIQTLEQKNSDFAVIVQSLTRVKNKMESSQELEEVIRVDIDSEDAEDESYYKDGAILEYYGKRYERNPKNRKAAIQIHGLSCVVCKFNFQKVYGKRGEDFIEVHHVNPLSTIGKEASINPETDLVPVCSNCHRMLHRRKNEMLSVNDLKMIIERCKEQGEKE
jgi:5-methylcytosine-specific restriction enzyme A